VAAIDRPGRALKLGTLVQDASAVTTCAPGAGGLVSRRSARRRSDVSDQEQQKDEQERPAAQENERREEQQGEGRPADLEPKDGDEVKGGVARFNG
jgi:hypothetical protein